MFVYIPAYIGCALLHMGPMEVPDKGPRERPNKGPNRRAQWKGPMEAPKKSPKEEPNKGTKEWHNQGPRARRNRALRQGPKARAQWKCPTRQGPKESPRERPHEVGSTSSGQDGKGKAARARRRLQVHSCTESCKGASGAPFT